MPVPTSIHLYWIQCEPEFLWRYGRPTWLLLIAHSQIRHSRSTSSTVFCAWLAFRMCDRSPVPRVALFTRLTCWRLQHSTSSSSCLSRRPLLSTHTSSWRYVSDWITWLWITWFHFLFVERLLNESWWHPWRFSCSTSTGESCRHRRLATTRLLGCLSFWSPSWFSRSPLSNRRDTICRAFLFECRFWKGLSFVDFNFCFASLAHFEVSWGYHWGRNRLIGENCLLMWHYEMKICVQSDIYVSCRFRLVELIYIICYFILLCEIWHSLLKRKKRIDRATVGNEPVWL